jgi:hypothetical protein
MALPQNLKNFIENKTNPKWDYLFGKLFLVQALTNFMTIIICPQWGVQIFANFVGVRSFFMILGHSWCEALCGAFYALSFWVNFQAFFNPFERRKMVNHFWMLQLLILLSGCGIILMLGASKGLDPLVIVSQVHLTWFLGYLVACVFMAQGQYRKLLLS